MASTMGEQDERGPSVATPSVGRSADGRFQAGNRAALQHGGRSNQVAQAALVEQAAIGRAVAEKRAAILTDLLGVTDHTALGPAERNAHDRGLPGHPRSERPNLVGCHVGMVSNITLSRSAAAVMDAPVPDEVQDGPRARGNRELHNCQLVRAFEELEEPGSSPGRYRAALSH